MTDNFEPQEMQSQGHVRCNSKNSNSYGKMGLNGCSAIVSN